MNKFKSTWHLNNSVCELQPSKLEDDRGFFSEIYNNLGKVVYNDNMILQNGANNVKIESGELTPGLYYMNAIINGESHLKPLTIIK